MRSSEFGSKSNSKSVLPLVETEDFIPIPPSDEEEGSEGDPDDYPVPQGLEAASEAQINKLSSTWLDIAPRSEGQPSLVRKGRKRNAVEMDEDMSESEYRQKLNMETRKTPWAKDVDWDGCVNVSQMLNDEVHAFVRYISPTLEEHATRGYVVQLVQDAITKEFPDAEILPFGSYETGLYLPLGDIDLAVKSPSMEQEMNRTAMLHKLAAVLRRANVTNKVEVIAKAKVPIVKFVTSYGRFPVDISINQMNGLAAGQIVTRFIKAMPAIKPLVLVIKSFLKQRNMNEVFSGGLGSYSIVCLVTSFLQMHPKLRRSKIDPMSNLGVLLVEFFETFGKHFNYKDVGISLRNGGFYFRKRDRGWYNPRKSFLLCIEDPQDPASDVSSGSFALSKIKRTLAGAFEVLSAALCLRGTELDSKKRGTCCSVRGDDAGGASRDPVEISLLGSIMGITQEVTIRRELIMELYNSGVLQKLVATPPPKDPPAPKINRRNQQAYDNQLHGHLGDSRDVMSISSTDEDTGRYDIMDTRTKRRKLDRNDSPGGTNELRATYIDDSDGIQVL